MKTIRKIAFNEYNGENIGFSDLNDGEEFIYINDGYEFPAWKVNKDFAILQDARGKYIRARAFANCLSIGAGCVAEYDDFDELKENILNGWYDNWNK